MSLKGKNFGSYRNAEEQMEIFSFSKYGFQHSTCLEALDKNSEFASPSLYKFNKARRRQVRSRSLSSVASMADSPPYTWLASILALWLIAAIARQVFDLIGKLWIPVAFNLLQILSCITGLFAVCQHRACLLIFLTVTSAISIIYNILIALWYGGFLGDNSRPLLSAGLPYSHSFFLLHTPMCEYHFNLTSLRWMQYPCPLPYGHIESLQAIVHVILAVITTVLSGVILYGRAQKKNYIEDRKKKHPKITVEFSSDANHGNRLKKPNPPDSINDIDSGFMNSSYDEGQDRDLFNGSRAPKPEGGYIRQSARKHRVKTNHLVGSGLPAFQKPSDNLRNATEAKKSVLEENDRFSRNDADSRQLYGFKNDFLGDDWNEYEDPYSKPRARSGSARSFKLPTTQNVRRMLSHEHLATSTAFDERKSVHRSSISNLTSLVSFDPKSNTLIRVREHMDDPSDDDFCEKAAGLPERPPSSDIPTTDAPPPPVNSRYIDISSTDSGRPSTDSNNGYDWSSSPIAYPSVSTQNRLPLQNDDDQMASTSFGYPIGYEPALCDPIPQFERQIAGAAGIPLVHEPIYRSNLQISSRRKNSIGHYHDPNTFRLMAYENEPRNPPASVPVINNNSVLV